VPLKFETTLVSRGPGGAWTYISVPFDVHKVFGTRARVPVIGTMNGFPFRNSLMPEGNGTHCMMISKELQAGADAHAGDTVLVILDRDEEPRTVDVPVELKAALKQSPPAARFFAGLTPSQKTDYATWVATAKQEATRASRATKAFEFLIAGKKRLR